MEHVAIARGLAAHLAHHNAAVAGGAGRLGYKVAFNSPAVQASVGLPYSLVAGLTRATLHPADAPYSLTGFTRPALEAEVAVWLDADISDEASTAEAAAAVGLWAPAVEVVDIDRAFAEMEEIVADGVFHRAVVLGDAVPAKRGADLAGLTASVHLGEALVCEVDAGEATGPPGDVLAHLARLLAPHREGLRAGDVVILGAMNPLTVAVPGTRFAVQVAGMGVVELSLTA